MPYDIFQVDAFTDKIFSGNPAAVVRLTEWLPDKTLLQIAAENNLSETAFFIPDDDDFHLRWFTPKVEVSLCGHATLATAWVIFHQMNWPSDAIRFKSLSGDLMVRRTKDSLILDFPALPSEKADNDPIIKDIFGKACNDLYKGPKWVAFFDNPDFIRTANPDQEKIRSLNAEGLIITAPGQGGYDMISRYFAPQIGIDEDPVTGAAHCRLVPIWAQKTGKTRFRAYQASARGGEMVCELMGDRVLLHGRAVLYMKGLIYI